MQIITVDQFINIQDPREWAKWKVRVYLSRAKSSFSDFPIEVSSSIAAFCDNCGDIPKVTLARQGGTPSCPPCFAKLYIDCDFYKP